MHSIPFSGWRRTGASLEQRTDAELSKHITVILSARDCFIELIHRASDPGMWNVRRSKKILWFRKRISSTWFSGEQQALAFAVELKRVHDAPLLLA